MSLCTLCSGSMLISVIKSFLRLTWLGRKSSIGLFYSHRIKDLPRSRCGKTKTSRLTSTRRLLTLLCISYLDWMAWFLVTRKQLPKQGLRNDHFEVQCSISAWHLSLLSTTPKPQHHPAKRSMSRVLLDPTKCLQTPWVCSPHCGSRSLRSQLRRPFQRRQRLKRLEWPQ